VCGTRTWGHGFPVRVFHIYKSESLISMRKLPVVVLSLWSISVSLAQEESLGTGEAAPLTIAPSLPALAQPEPKNANGIHWGALFRDWWLNLAMEQTERILKEPKTRDQLSGPFFKGWIDTVSAYRFDRWDDNDKFVTSYLGQPNTGRHRGSHLLAEQRSCPLLRPGLP